MRHGSKTFLAASLLLPRGVREPAAALYAFCRLADDAVDAQGAEQGPRRKGSRDAVERLRVRLHMAYAGTPQDDPADRALAVVVRQHHIPAALFDALLEGFEWDLQGRRYDSLADLQDYGARVAGTVGAMMALLMGVRSVEGLARACDLGLAMQLSNIARDVGEDARMGRLYLPRAWMSEVGLDPDAWLAEPVFSPALGAVVQRLLDTADALYGGVADGIARLPLVCRPGINAARFMYAAIGHEVARRGLDSVSARARVPGRRKAWLLVRSVAALAPPVASVPPPPLAANRFLVDAALAALAAQAEGPRPDGQRMTATQPDAPVQRGLVDRVVWTAELFARLEQRERSRLSSRMSGSGLAT